MNPRRVSRASRPGKSAPRLAGLMLLSLLLSSLALTSTLCSAAPAAADTRSSPVRLAVELEPQELAPGDSAELRVQVLVPTWMPEPVTFPSLDQPGLRVTLGDRATTPISQRVDGKTWSGVSRRYRLTPLSAGRFELGSGSLEVTYASPEDNSPTQQRLTLPPVTLTARLPEAAEGLDPYLSARDIELTQTLEIVRAGKSGENGEQAQGQKGDDGDADDTENAGDDRQSPEQDDADGDSGPIELEAGDSVTRTVTARLSGGSALLLPDLLSATAKEAGDETAMAPLGVYPETPRLEESSDGGTRTDRVTYVAETGGKSSLPGVSLRWYDPESDSLEQAELAPIEVSVSAPRAARSAEDWSRLVLGVLPWLLGLVLLVSLATWLWRHLAIGAKVHAHWQHHQQQQRQRREASGVAGLQRLKRSLDARDLVAVRRHWEALEPHLDSNSEARAHFANRLDALCRARLGPDREIAKPAAGFRDTGGDGGSDGDGDGDGDGMDSKESLWQRLAQALPSARELASSRPANRQLAHDRLTALNPTAQVTRRNA
ncbi:MULTISPECIES: BatD family protein [unclassified Halomonas]|uniref:BatD family protein n=1 Tax=unclassified Halomonas TaxID=2609666 RepID=UPI0005FA3320|nr:MULTISPECIES: BatD family protein [unclassified Halomonas]MCO7217693.1 BatD family protein [Halomonas sp. OfavH-34-E]